MRLLFTAPAALLGIVCAIVFFKIYGVLTRPDVPAPVAMIVGQFAPGVEIGAKVDEARHRVAGMTYVPHLGYVGLPGQRDTNLPGGNRVAFAQVRLLVDEKARAQTKPDPKKARIEAVEVVSVEGHAWSEIANALNLVFRKGPKLGCVTSSDEESQRDVQIWTTPNERGGVALFAELGSINERYPGLHMTHVLAFRGKFAGSETLLGNYRDSSCATLSDGQ